MALRDAEPAEAARRGEFYKWLVLVQQGRCEAHRSGPTAGRTTSHLEVSVWKTVAKLDWTFCQQNGQTAW